MRRCAAVQEAILGIVCGLAEPSRSNRRLLMLKAYIDDSGLNQPPAYFLGGWLASVATWSKFTRDWDAALRMSPRIEYFKLNEAMNGSGEFYGISVPMRNEKLRVLAHVIADHRLTCVSAMVPHGLFQDLFADSRSNPFMSSERLFRNPYYFMFFGLISCIYKFQRSRGRSEKIEFIFDEQVDQENIVIPIWTSFRQSSPPEVRDMLSGTINFLNDKTVLPLQAADFCAGGFNLNAKNIVAGNEKASIWSGIVDDLDHIDWILTPELAAKIFGATIPIPNRIMNASLPTVWRVLLEE